jgi:tetratricopeptide (TPR) repeat protein
VIRSILACCLIVCAICAADNLPSHQGTVVLADRSFPDVWISSETMDAVVHTLDERRDSPPTTLNHGRYLRVDYNRPNDVGWLRGDAAASKGDWAAAAAQFMEATKSRESWYTRENGFMRAAEAYFQAGKPDEAIKTLDGLTAAFPKSVQQARIAYLRGQALQKKGDAAGAIKIFADLAGKANTWGVEAAALGALGQAELLIADQKPEEAGKALSTAFAKLDASKDAELFGRVGIALANSQQAAKQNDEALATLRRLAYGVADGPSRARAQLTWAKLLQTAGDSTLFEAFDHALIAMSARDADAATSEQAATLARQIVGRIDKLPEAQASNELKAEYRRYMSR